MSKARCLLHEWPQQNQMQKAVLLARRSDIAVLARRSDIAAYRQCRHIPAKMGIIVISLLCISAVMACIHVLAVNIAMPKCMLCNSIICTSVKL